MWPFCDLSHGQDELDDSLQFMMRQARLEEEGRRGSHGKREEEGREQRRAAEVRLVVLLCRMVPDLFPPCREFGDRPVLSQAGLCPRRGGGGSRYPVPTPYIPTSLHPYTPTYTPTHTYSLHPGREETEPPRPPGRGEGVRGEQESVTQQVLILRLEVFCHSGIRHGFNFITWGSDILSKW